MRYTKILFFLLTTVSMAFSREVPFRIDFSGDTAEKNGVIIQGPGFDTYPPAQVSFGEIPSTNAFEDATDGRGVTVSALPGEGVMIMGETIHTLNTAMIRCSVRSSAGHAAITIAAIGAGSNQFVSTNSPYNGQFFTGQYRRLSGFFVPPSTGFRPLIQIVNTSETQNLTVYIDNFDVYLLDSGRFYHAQFMDGDEADPSITSMAEPPDGTPADRIHIQPSYANISIGEQMQFQTDYVINGDGRVSWRVDRPETVRLVSDGLVQGESGGNAWLSVLFGSMYDRALLFVNPVPAFHNDRDYEWYQTQMGTGPASYNNCGPASTHMAIRWYSGENIPVENLRDLYSRNNEWWFTSYVTGSLNQYGVPHTIRPVTYKNDILQCLKRGNIVILCGEMEGITYSREPNFGRYYNLGGGHFYVVKGWSADENYFIVYDPNAFANDYDNQGIMLGRNRFYRCEETVESIQEWWPYCIEIGESSIHNTSNLMNIPDGKAGPRSLSSPLEKQ